MTATHVLTILAVGDLPRAVAFYVDGFGWPKVVTPGASPTDSRGLRMESWR